MSIEMYQRNVNKLDAEIENLEKKKFEFDRKVSNTQSKISSIERSITKRTSSTMLNSKIRQIDSLKRNIVRYSKNSADLNKKIVDKRKRRNEQYLKLQHEENVIRKKQEREFRDMKNDYEKRIAESTKIPDILNKQVEINEDQNIEKYDVFVSHAWEDKESFVDEFVNCLRKLDLKVWYDKSEISWGDSMRKRIDEGLRKSTFGVAVLTPNYIADEKYWTKSELDGLFQLESIMVKHYCQYGIILQKKK